VPAERIEVEAQWCDELLVLWFHNENGCCRINSRLIFDVGCEGQCSSGQASDSKLIDNDSSNIGVLTGLHPGLELKGITSIEELADIRPNMVHLRVQASLLGKLSDRTPASK
jgi:hypothetical protein